MGRPVIADGSLEAMKWLGLLAMTGDHVDKYLFNGTINVLFDAGRIAMPVFACVLACNLARPGVLTSGAYMRTMKRLMIFGVLGTPAFVALGGLWAGWWPLNIMFALLAITATLYLVDRGAYIAAVVLFVMAGSSVEFWWPGLTVGVAVWWYCRRPGWMPLTCGVVALASLGWVNGNLWALAAVPLLLLASHVDLRVPRLRWVFYVFYPLHLSVLWLIRIPMGRAGYLFFG